MKKTVVLLAVLTASLLAYFYMPGHRRVTRTLNLKSASTDAGIDDKLKPQIDGTSETPLRVKRGKSAAFMVRTSGGSDASPLQFEWDFRPKATTTWRRIPGASVNHLEVASVATTNEGEYRVTVKISANKRLQKTEAIFALDLSPTVPAFILDPPKPVETKVGRQAQFSVNVAGEEPITCEWQFLPSAKAKESGSDSTSMASSRQRNSDKRPAGAAGLKSCFTGKPILSSQF